MRRTLLKTLALAPAVLAFPRVWAQAGKPEKSKLTIAVGGKNLFYYLPLTIAEQLGHFKDEGLQVEIPDFAGGSKALQALVGGSADVVSGAYEHTINMQAKNQFIESFVLQGRAPQIVLAVSTKTMPDYKSLADLKGKKIGVTAPGSSTSMMASYVLAKAGIKPKYTAVLGTVAGDLHDIGKNLVGMMWKGANIGVVDVGTNVSPEKFVEAIKANNAQVVGLSALLTTTMPAMKTTVDAIRAAGLTDVKIMVGGAPVTEEFAREIGADAYGTDAASAVDVLLKMVGG